MSMQQPHPEPLHVPPEVPASQPHAASTSSPEASAMSTPVAAVTSSPVITHVALATPADAAANVQADAAATSAIEPVRTHPPLTTADLAAHLSLRDVVLRAYPDVVAELVQGETLADLFATLPRAQEAWQRVVAQVDAGAAASGAGDGSSLTSATLPAIDRAAIPAPTPAPSVASGSPVRSGQPGLEHLTPLARIRAGLRSS